MRDYMIVPLSPSIILIALRILLVVLVVSVASAALFVRYAYASAAAVIPEDAIRIRIIANSDSERDQQVKRDIQASVSEAIAAWGEMPDTHDEAKAFIKRHLGQLQLLIDTKLEAHNAAYAGKVELAEVPFPEKEYGGQTYAAGDYEALRITLGGGEGANWWCVLFPPLCITAATAQDEAVKPAVADDKQDGAKPEPAFFLVVLIQKIIAFFAALFS